MKVSLLAVIAVTGLSIIPCCHHAPKTAPPPQVVVAPRPVCNLPALPGPIAPVVGWPTPETVLVSKSDFVLMLQYVQGLRDWIDAATPCLTQSFAGELDTFLRGGK